MADTRRLTRGAGLAARLGIAVLVAPILAAPILAAPVLAAERVGIDEDNNVVTAFGTPIRGVPFFLDAFSVWDAIDGMGANLATYEDYYRRGLESSQMNAVRCAPWIGPHEYFRFDENQDFHREQYDILLDNCVRWAKDNDVYAIVNYHTQFGTVLDAGLVKGFWDVYAPRYGDETHVVFELVNEPETESVKREMQGIYDHVRALAPDTHMILWSLFDPTTITADEIKASTPGIDYQADNVSVGWHNYYDVGNTSAWDRADAFAAAGLPVINTEFWSLMDRDDLPISYGNVADNVREGESRGRSWMLWGPFLNYQAVSVEDTHDDLKFSPAFEDAVRNGARTIATKPGLQDGVFRAGLDGSYWTKWGPSVAVDPSDGGDGPALADAIGFGAAPDGVDLSGAFTVTADYEAPGRRDVVLEVFDQRTGAWLGQAAGTVEAGRGSTTLTASAGPIPAGTYRLKLGIRPVGGDWRASYLDVYRDGVTASEGGAASAKPTIRLNAADADEVGPGVRAYPGAGVGSVGPGRWIKFARVDLGVDGYDRIRARIATRGSGRMEVRAQRLDGPVLTVIDFQGDSFDFEDAAWRTSAFPGWEYPQELYFVVTSGWANLADTELIDD